MQEDQRTQLAQLVGVVVISVAIVGYFTGLQSPMNPALSEAGAGASLRPIDSDHEPETHPADGVIPATHYADMPAATEQRTKDRRTSFANLKSTIDPLAEVKIQPGEKEAALRLRQQNRAFNGAPPTIPHPIDQGSDRACAACHVTGARTHSLRIPRMSHRMLANCTQCHVENNPPHRVAALFRESTFRGLPAPSHGDRSFPGAPPTVPHSTWMREDCLSCHGFAGLQGLRTTHPWRNNCLQCHAPSATMDQTLLIAEPKFLPAPNIDN